MISKIDFGIDELTSMKKYPEELFYMGNIDLLKKEKYQLLDLDVQIVIQKSLHIN